MILPRSRPISVTAGSPFRWDEGRRFAMRCELDAAFFHLYGIERNDVGYIMRQLPRVSRTRMTSANSSAPKR